MSLTQSLKNSTENSQQNTKEPLVLWGKKSEFVQKLKELGFTHDAIHDEYFLNNVYVRDNLYNQGEESWNYNSYDELRGIDLGHYFKLIIKNQIKHERVWKQIRVLFDHQHYPYIDIFTYNGTIWRFMNSGFQILHLGGSNYLLPTHEFDSLEIFREGRNFSIPRPVLI